MVASSCVPFISVPPLLALTAQKSRLCHNNAVIGALQEEFGGVRSPPTLIIRQAGGPQSPLILLLGPELKKKKKDVHAPCLNKSCRHGIIC